MRQPPKAVPHAMAAWQARMIHSVFGSVSDSCVPWFTVPAAMRSARMMPMVFCASFPPCPSE